LKQNSSEHKSPTNIRVTSQRIANTISENVVWWKNTWKKI